MKDLGRTGHARMLFERGLDARLVTHQQELEPIVPAAGERRPGDHHTHAFITAHRINGDTRQAHACDPLQTKGLQPFGLDDLAAIVMATSRAQIVRTLQLTAVGAFVECFDLQRIMRPAIAAAMRRYFSLRDSHCGTCSLKMLNSWLPP